MDTPVCKRSVVLNGRKTSVSVEEPFWTALRDIARDKRVKLYNVVEEIDHARTRRTNLSSAIRVFVMQHFRDVANGLVRRAASGFLILFGLDDIMGGLL